MKNTEAADVFKKIMTGYTGFWCVAGGWAIDLFLDRETRSHEDFEIIILRDEQVEAFRHFQIYQPLKIFTHNEEPELVNWNGEEIESDVIQLRLDPVKSSEGMKEFDILLTPSIANDWICRRDEEIKLPLDVVAIKTSSGIPVLAPEIVLLFKAKYLREKDLADFSSVKNIMSSDQKNWLKKSLEKIHPEHEWIAQL